MPRAVQCARERRHHRQQQEHFGIRRRRTDARIRRERREHQYRPGRRQPPAQPLPHQNEDRGRRRQAPKVHQAGAAECGVAPETFEGQPIGGERSGRLLIERVAVGDVACLHAPGDVGVLALVALERQVEQRCTQRDEGARGKREPSYDDPRLQGSGHEFSSPCVVTFDACKGVARGV